VHTNHLLQERTPSRSNEGEALAEGLPARSSEILPKSHLSLISFEGLAQREFEAKVGKWATRGTQRRHAYCPDAENTHEPA